MHAKVSTFQDPAGIPLADGEQKLEIDIVPDALVVDRNGPVPSPRAAHTPGLAPVTGSDSEDAVRASEGQAKQVRSHLADFEDRDVAASDARDLSQDRHPSLGLVIAGARGLGHSSWS